MRTTDWLGWSVLLAGVAMGCGDDGQPVEHNDDCNAVDPSVCTLPFPSSYFLQEDPSADSGQRVHFGATSLPRHNQVGHVDPTYFNEKDGFSILTPMLFYFDDVSLEGTVTHENIGDSLLADSKTVVVNAETGEKVPHWVELDATTENRQQTVVIIRPAEPMDFATRYVVGVRGLTDTSGSPIDPSPVFRALRSGSGGGDQVERQRPNYEDVIFPVLDGAGFAREDLQIAWDFVTKSRQSTIGQALAARDDAMAQWESAEPEYTLQVEDFNCGEGGEDGIGREILVDMTVPLYTETDEPGTLLTRDADGLPEPNGTTTEDFVIRVPCSVIDAPEAASAPLLQYGHGLLGGFGEARTRYLSQFANDHGYILFAADWKGMAGEDMVPILEMINTEPGKFNTIPERSVQGFVEFMAAATLMQGDLADDPALQFGEPAVSVVDTSRLYYYGNSQGGILGGAYTALSPDVQRGVLGVGGMPYSLLLPRSVDFNPFFDLFRIQFDDHRERMIFITGLTQMLWDLGEGAGFAHDMDKDVLLQVAINDHQVTTLGAHIQARAWGASTVMPQTRPVWGVSEMTAPFEGSALVEFLYPDIMDEPFEARPPEDEEELPRNGDPHECPRRDPAGQLQMSDFLQDGTINHHCDGICDDELQETCR
ncbi:MAG: hypothetical protein ACOC9T_01930 [Myxococcota bacterium]